MSLFKHKKTVWTIDGKRVAPDTAGAKKLLEHGYEFRRPKLDDALASLMGKAEVQR